MDPGVSKMKAIVLCSVISIISLGVGVVIGVSIPTNQSNIKTAAELEVEVYRKVWAKCRSDKIDENKCKSLMIHSVSDRLNGESPVPDGYVYVFSDAYSPSEVSLAYKVMTISRGKEAGRIFPVQRLNQDEIHEIPE